MSMLFARWKGAKYTIEHAMHVLHAYCMFLVSLWPNKVLCLCWGSLWHVVVLLTICFGMNKLFFFFNFGVKPFRIEIHLCIMYCSHLLHIFYNYIVNTVVYICRIIADCVGAVQVYVGFPARILYGRPTYMSPPRMCSPTVWNEARHIDR